MKASKFLMALDASGLHTIGLAASDLDFLNDRVFDVLDALGFGTSNLVLLDG